MFVNKYLRYNQRFLITKIMNKSITKGMCFFPVQLKSLTNKLNVFSPLHAKFHEHRTPRHHKRSQQNTITATHIFSPMILHNTLFYTTKFPHTHTHTHIQKEQQPSISLYIFYSQGRLHRFAEFNFDCMPHTLEYHTCVW